MKKITLNFPEYLCCFVADKMMSIVNDETFRLTADLRAIIKAAEYEPADTVVLEATPLALKAIVEALGQEPEYVATDINQELRAALTPQLMKYLNPMDENYLDISESDPDLLESVMFVANFFAQRDDQKLAWRNSKIESGRQRLLA